MIHKEPGYRSRFFLVLGFQLLEHCGHRIRIVAGRPHVLNAELVSFFLCATSELQKAHALEKAGAVVQHITEDRTAQQDTGQHPIIDNLHFSHVFHGVARTNVANFMRHHTGQLSFIVSRENQSLIYEEEAAR